MPRKKLKDVVRNQRPHIQSTPKIPTMEEEREKRLIDAMHLAVELLGEEIMSISPREVMLMAMRTALKAGWVFKAAQIAADVAPYVHAKLQSVTVASGNEDEQRSDEDLRSELDEIRARAAGADRARALAAPVQDESQIVGHPGNGAGGILPGSAPRPTLQ